MSERVSRTALRAAWLFDGTETLKPDPVVVFEGSAIVAVRLGAPAPSDAELVDLGEVTLLPGLVDTHVHLVFDASPDPVAGLEARSGEEILDSMRRAGRTALAGGVTTVRDLGDRGYLSLALRGEADLPTVLSAGPPITTSGGHCHFLGGVAERGVEGVRAAVRQHVQRGVDVVKIMATGGNLTPGSHQHLAQFSAEEMQAAVDEAHHWGLPITAHAHGTAGLRNAVAAGVDGLEHASFWSEDGVDDPGDLIERILEKRIIVGATLGLAPVPGLQGPPEVLKRIPSIIANTRRMHQAGVRVVAGTDAGIAPVKPHDALRYAMAPLMDLGMSAAAALHTMTSVAAEVCGVGAVKGRLEVGYDADILAVRGNPLADPQSIHRIEAVYARGKRATA